jgi:hypothetical protein
MCHAHHHRRQQPKDAEIRLNIEPIDCDQQSSQQAVREAMNIALTAALRKSNRAALGWALLDREYRFLAANSLIIGADEALLYAQLQQYAAKLYHLCLTTDPVTALLDPERLIEAIEASGCRQLTFSAASATVSPSSAAKRWQQWQTQWQTQPGCRIHILPATQITEKLIAGAQKAERRGLPWLTSVSSGNWHGAELPLTEFVDEFGFSAFLQTLVNQASAILYTASQQHIVPLLPTKNYAKQEQLICEISSLSQLESVLRYCVSQKRTNAVIFCDLPFLQQLVHQQQCDEIVYHLGLVSRQTVAAPQWQIPFEQWSIVSSDAIGKCLRIVLQQSRSDNPLMDISLAN